MIKKIINTALISVAVLFAQVSPTFLWDGKSDTEAKVLTGSEEETSGYWYEYDDNSAPNNGDSKFVWPDNFEENTYGNFFGPLVEANGGIKGTVELGTAYEYPFAGIGFNVWSENQEGVDISAWKGICLTYTSTIGLAIELGVEDEATVTGYNNYKAAVSKSNLVVATDYPWAKFKQETGWGETVPQADVLAKTAAIKLKFSTASGDFNIIQVGSVGQCTAEGNAIHNSYKNANISFNDNSISLNKKSTVNIYNMNGSLLNSMETNFIDMSTYSPGLYVILTNDMKLKFLVK